MILVYDQSGGRPLAAYCRPLLRECKEDNVAGVSNRQLDAYVVEGVYRRNSINTAFVSMFVNGSSIKAVFCFREALNRRNFERCMCAR